MAIKKYATLNTLSNFLDNLKNLFATKTEMNAKSDKAHTHTVADVANLQSTLNSKANSSHGIHVTYSTAAHVMDGSASIGSANTVARSDHRHPTDTSRASQTSLDSHTGNTTNHITSTERANWNAAYTHSQVSHAPNNAEPNQNAFSNVKVGDVTIAADIKTDTLTLVAGNNITITPDATNDKVTISSTDTNTTYSAGTGISLSGTTFSNSGVRSVSTGASNGTISVNTNGTTANVAVKGLGSAAYTASTAYDAAGAANNALASAKTYADNAANKVKNDLLNGAGGAYDTLKELGDLIDDNTDAIDALEVVAAGKANKAHTHAISDITNLQTTLNNKSDNTHTHNSIVSRGNTQAETEATRPSVSGISMTQAYNNGYPQNYGNILNLKGQGDGQLLIGWSGTSGSHAPIHVRSKRDVSDAKWSDWAQIYTTAYKPTPSDIGAAPSSHTHKVADITDLTATATELNYIDGVTSNVQTQLDGKAALSHSHSASNITSGTLSSDRLPTVPVAKGGTGATTAAGALTNLGITATAYELNKLDGVTATTAELNYVDGVTSNIQTQLNGKSSTSHSHNSAGSSLGFVKSGGDVTISDGVITVNDDSHNHTMANIDNLQTTLNGKEDIISWSAITQGQTWSRICLVKANTGVVGWSGILSVGFTRGNVVGNATFAINASHSNTVYITQLNANKYSTFQIRGVTDSNATNTYIEIYDSANNIESGTNQTMYCKFIPLLGCTVTKYTAFASGATIPSGYTAGSTLTVDTSGGSMVASKFVGGLSGNATSATKSIQDGNGNNIVNTYATKTELNNTKSNLQTQIDSKAASSHGTHVTWATSVPKANGTAAVGTVARVAKEDHVHPLQTTVSGNAGTATTISKRVKITSSQSANAGKYIKFGTITLPNGYSGFMGYLMFNPTEGSGGANGLLHLYIRNGADNTTTSCTMKWLTLNESKYEKTVFAVKVSNGIFDLYYKPINTWDTMEVIVVSGDNHGTLTLANSGTYVDSITATYTSSIGGQVNYANSAGSATSATTASTCTGNAATATKLSSAKTISLTGDVTGSTSFDGSGNVSITATVADDSHNHVISNIDSLQSALDGKSATSHTHTADNLVSWANALFGTNNQGGVEYSYGSGSGKNVLTEISNMPQGLHTAYAISGTAGNPKTNESFRFLIHKTSGTIGWILAWDAQGSLFTNYQSADSTFKGWKCVYDAAPSALWTGGYYMSSSDGNPQTVKPSKKLSECRNGWVLVWSDYDPDTSTKNNTDIHHDYVFKKNCAGANWSGQCMLCDIPRYMGSNAQDVDTERRILKAIYIHDDRIEGSYQGSYDERNDVILRAIYEF